MANYKGHIIGGGVAGTAVLAALYFVPIDFLPTSEEVLTDPQIAIGLIVLSILFGLWPDVDTNSKAQDIFYGIGFALNIFLIVSGFYLLSALLGFLAMTPIVGKHRGWTHSKIAMILVPAPILIIPYLSTEAIGPTGLLTYCMAVAGYFSHLLLDGLIWKRIRIKGGW